MRQVEGDFMRTSALSLIISFFLMAYITSCSSCTEQHDPRPDQARFEAEQKLANASHPKLTAEGKIPETPVAAGEGGDPIDKKFQTLCASCHGANGDANSPTAASMSPKPRDFTDAAWQGSVDDARIAKVIKEGGASVGLSATMAPWGAMVSDAELEGLVKKIRAFKK